MEERKEAMTVGILALVLAMLVRLISAGGILPSWNSSTALSLLVYLQTGRVVRPPQYTPPATVPEETQPSVPPATQSQMGFVPAFSPQDGESVEINDLTNYDPDVESLLLSPLEWDLRQDSPTVLILHTHGTESYTKQPGETYEEESDYRTLDENYNMLSIGAELQRILAAGGVQAIHDTTYHDYPSYDGSYDNARQTIKKYLQQYPTICVVIDLHRDALNFEEDPQLSTMATVEGMKAAQLMLVAGTDANLSYPNWQENLAFGVKLTAVLEGMYPGITRPIQLRAQRFNLDMTPGSILVEVGANGDSHSQAMASVRALGWAILALAGGANLQDAPPS